MYAPIMYFTRRTAYCVVMKRCCKISQPTKAIVIDNKIGFTWLFSLLPFIVAEGLRCVGVLYLPVPVQAFSQAECRHRLPTAHFLQGSGISWRATTLNLRYRSSLFIFIFNQQYLMVTQSLFYEHHRVNRTRIYFILCSYLWNGGNCNVIIIMTYQTR